MQVFPGHDQKTQPHTAKNRTHFSEGRWGGGSLAQASEPGERTSVIRPSDK